MIQTAIKLKAENGILSLPGKRQGNKLPEDIKLRILEYYSNPDFSQVRMMPGKNDCVSMGKGNFEQKRLILCNLKEMHQDYTVDFPNDKVGLSIFCSLRPKYSIIAGASGTHTVCVCEKHQNVKLMLYSCKSPISYRDLISLLVNKEDSIKCMMRLCTVCSDKSRFK